MTKIVGSWSPSGGGGEPATARMPCCVLGLRVLKTVDVKAIKIRVTLNIEYFD